MRFPRFKEAFDHVQRELAVERLAVDCSKSFKLALLCMTLEAQRLEVFHAVVASVSKRRDVIDLVRLIVQRLHAYGAPRAARAADLHALVLRQWLSAAPAQ